MIKISGSQIAQHIVTRLRSQPQPNKKLVAVTVGNDPASLSFLRQKGRAALELGVGFELKQFEEGTSDVSIKDYLQNLAEESSTGGVIVQLPLPEGMPTQSILDMIPAEKDVDILSSEATRLFKVGESKVIPPSAGTVKEILHSQKFDLKNKSVAIIGLGRLVGRPVSIWLKDKVDRLVSIEIENDINQIKEADLIISGVGKPQLINPSLLKEGSTVIDFGYGKLNSQPSGDLDTSNEQALSKLSAYTPTPDGTGPILVAKLLENFYLLSEN